MEPGLGGTRVRSGNTMLTLKVNQGGEVEVGMMALQFQGSSDHGGGNTVG